MISVDTNVLSMKYVGNTKKVLILFCGGGGGVTKNFGCVCVTKLYDISFAFI